MASMLRLPADSGISDKNSGSPEQLQHPTEGQEVEPVLLDRPVGQGGAHEDALGGKQSDQVEGAVLNFSIV